MPSQEYLQSLERELKYRNYSQRTIQAYTTCVKFFLEKHKKAPQDLSRDEIIDFVLFLQSKWKALKTLR